MVKGLEMFRDHFAEFDDAYVLIGGAAVDLLMEEAGLQFRATRDLDIVLTLEVIDTRFVQAFWTFIEAGDNQQRERSGRKEFYRFVRPAVPEYPAQLELFSRIPDSTAFDGQGHLTPLLLDQELASLSAIVLNDTYYDFIHSRNRRVQGISCLGEEGLIPLKAKAWLDLTERRRAGQQIHAGDIRKHRNDILRLSQLFSEESRFVLPAVIHEDLQQFIEAVASDVTEELLNNLNVGDTPDEVLGFVKDVYSLE